MWPMTGKLDETRLSGENKFSVSTSHCGTTNNRIAWRIRGRSEGSFISHFGALECFRDNVLGDCSKLRSRENVSCIVYEVDEVAIN